MVAFTTMPNVISPAPVMTSVVVGSPTEVESSGRLSFDAVPSNVSPQAANNNRDSHQQYISRQEDDIDGDVISKEKGFEVGIEGKESKEIRFSPSFIAQALAQAASKRESLAIMRVYDFANDNQPVRTLNNKLMIIFSNIKYLPSYAGKYHSTDVTREGEELSPSSSVAGIDGIVGGIMSSDSDNDNRSESNDTDAGTGTMAVTSSLSLS